MRVHQERSIVPFWKELRMRRLTKKIVVSLVMLIAATSSASLAAEPLSDEEALLLRGGTWFTATECVVGAGGCPGGFVANTGNGTSTTQCADGMACSTCGTATNWVCSAPYGTNNLFDLNCVVDPALSCNGDGGVCIAGSCDTSQHPHGPVPGGCGTSTDCHN